jgi:histidinol-phosphate aminotransferase
MNPENLIRPNIRTLKAYASARDDYKGRDAVFLDANESPYGRYNRYPDPYQQQLKDRIAAIKQVPAENLFIGNGSDEVIDLAFRICCGPGKDKALTFAPTYGMYEVSAAINDVTLLQCPLNEQFDLDYAAITPLLDDPDLKLILLCSPNNPAGNLLDTSVITQLLESFKGLVLIDEAYIDFAAQDSWLSKLAMYPNLVVCQTLSKAWGMAGLRLGLGWMHPQLLHYFNKVKPPYNVSVLNQQAALEVLAHEERFSRNCTTILQERERVRRALAQIACVKQVYPSDANFLLVQVTGAQAVYDALRNGKVIVRNRAALIKNTLRITIGDPAENDQLIQALQQFDYA